MAAKAKKKDCQVKAQMGTGREGRLDFPASWPVHEECRDCRPQPGQPQGQS